MHRSRTPVIKMIPDPNPINYTVVDSQKITILLLMLEYSVHAMYVKLLPGATKYGFS
jgi:hypothetical protein